MRGGMAIILAVLLAGCLQAPTPAELGAEYLASDAAGYDPTTRALVARSIAAQGINLHNWPSTQAPIVDELETEPYSAALHGLLAARGQEWIDAVWAGHDGEQFGDPGLLTDDMLAVQGLLLVGESRTDPRIDDAVARIQAAQQPDGGWRYDGAGPGEVDETAWALKALVAAQALEPHMRQAAVDFLINAPEPTGLYAHSGVANCQSTAWALVAWDAVDIIAPPMTRQALLSCQNPDGGFGWLPGEESQAWATAEALIGLAA